MVKIIDLNEKTNNVVNNDYLIVQDSEDLNEIKKIRADKFVGPTGIEGPQGPKGDGATVSVGTTTTGAEGTSANVTNSGTATDAILDFTIPKGDTGPEGPRGQTGKGVIEGGTTGQVLAKKSDSDYDTEWKDIEEGTSSAEETTVDTTNFNKNLSSTEDTVQKALDKLDDLEVSSTAADTSVDTTNFDKNLSNSDDTVQKALQTINDLEIAGTALPTYTITNDTEDREFDADDYTTDELADVLATHIRDTQEGLIGPEGPAGADGQDGEDGVGVIEGGTTGQVLAKKSDDDYDTEWTDVAQGGHTIQDEGTNLTNRSNLNFVGDAVEATDDSGSDTTIVTINHQDISGKADDNTVVHNTGDENIDGVKTFNNDVGIGTTNPSEKLEVTGNIKLPTNSTGIIMYDNNGDGYKLSVVDGALELNSI